MHDLVALLADVQAAHWETHRPLVLRRGQIGTVVMTYHAPTVEVEFSGRDGRPYAILPVDLDHLLVLRDTPDHAAVG